MARIQLHSLFYLVTFTKMRREMATRRYVKRARRTFKVRRRKGSDKNCHTVVLQECTHTLLLGIRQVDSNFNRWEGKQTTESQHMHI